MSARKLRAVLVAFCVGFLLALGVLAVSRLLVYSQSFGQAAGMADWITVGFAALAVVMLAFLSARSWQASREVRAASPLRVAEPATPTNAAAETTIALVDPARAELEQALRQAIEREEFVLFYQPQLELASGKVRGYEALLRWERPGQGIVSPRDFLEAAEESGQIAAIGEWVLRKACADAAGWLDSGTVAVNLCAPQFRLAEMDRVIAGILAETGLPADRLEIEVPESLFLKPSPAVMETLGRIKALGVRVAMDDFGASYSSLASIAHFPFDKIKIDKSFVAQLEQDADVAAIVAAIVGLGRAVSVDVTAEGVENNDQVTLLKAAGCSIVQGFLFGMPKRDAKAPFSRRERVPAQRGE